MNLEAVMPMSAWWALTIAVLAAIIQVHRNDYDEVWLRIAHWVEIQLGLWAAFIISVILISWALQ